MAAFDTVEASHLMLEIVNPRIAQAFEQDTSMWNLLSQGKAADTNSRGVRIVAYVQPNPSIGWLGESQPFPNSGKPTHVEMNVKYVRAYKVGEITGDVKDLDGRNQIARYIATAVSETTQNFKKEINRQCFGDGTGTIGVVSSAVTGAGGTITFLQADGVFGARKLDPGLQVNVFNAAGSTQRGGAGTVSTVSTSTPPNLNTGVVTFDTVPSGTVQSDIVVANNSLNNAIHGLAYHVNNSGTYQNVSRTNYPQLNATVVDAGAASLSAANMDLLLHKMLYKTGQMMSLNDLIIVSSPTQRQAYLALGYDLKRFGKSDGFDSSFSFDSTTHAGIKWRIDVDCPDDRIYFLRPSSLQRYQVRPIGVIDLGTGILAPKTNAANSGSGYQDAFLFHLGGKLEIGSANPRYNAVLKNNGLTGFASGLFQ